MENQTQEVPTPQAEVKADPLAVQAENLRKEMGIDYGQPQKEDFQRVKTTLQPDKPPKEDKPKEPETPPAESEEKAPEDQPKPDTELEELQKANDELQKKIDRLEDTLQKRTSKLTGERKALEEEVETIRKKDLPEGEKFTEDDLAEEEHSVLKKLLSVKKQIRKAELDDDDEALDKFHIDEERLRLQLNSIEREARALRRRQGDRVHQKQVNQNHEVFVKSWERAFDQFPELVKDNRPDFDHPVMQEVQKLMQRNGVKPKFALKADRINPDFDNPNGPYFAVLQAMLNLKGKEPEVKDHKETIKLKKQNEKLKAKEQPLTDTRSMGPLEGEGNAKFEKIRDRALARGATEEEKKAYTLAVLRKVNG